ncbi:MAG: hypothetical protein LQ340_006208 [Diploschistes diacapsis]|nr:MAG: hypothetical protein LQ340_006208 [Diploschistes diacapsis]
MFFHLLYIHLFRPFLNYTQANSPLPQQISPRKMCTQAAVSISKLVRLYKKTFGLRQICNIAVYIIHSACTIHLLNLPDKGAKRDISHNVRHLEEIASSWLCASRTLATLGIQARRWKIELPENTASILERWESKYRSGHPSPALDKSSPTIEQVQKIASSKDASSKDARAWALSATPAGTLFPRPPAVISVANSEPLSQQAIPSDPIAVNAPPAATSYHHRHPTPQQPSYTAWSSWDVSCPGVSAVSMTPPISQPRRPSYSVLFPGLDTLFEDSKDWWLRDQSAFFDYWSSRRDPSMNLAGVAQAADPSANGISGLMSTTQTTGQNVPATNGILGTTQSNCDVNMSELGHWGFGVEGTN